MELPYIMAPLDKKIEIPDALIRRITGDPMEFNKERQLIRNLKRENEDKMRSALRTVEFIRPEILDFAENMELVMRKHDSVKGDSWKLCDPDFLFDKFVEEFLEAFHSTDETGVLRLNDEFRSELIDLANVSMMLWVRGKPDDERD